MKESDERCPICVAVNTNYKFDVTQQESSRSTSTEVRTGTLVIIGIVAILIGIPIGKLEYYEQSVNVGCLFFMLNFV